jgi:hypothetical protein
VELALPETGVCGGVDLFDTPVTQQAYGDGCCAPRRSLSSPAPHWVIRGLRTGKV